MRLFLLAAIFVHTIEGEKNCHGVYFNDRYYDIEILKDGINQIHNLVLNRNDNTLYFTLDQIARVPTRVLGYLKIDTRESGLIDGIRNATAVAIDQATNTVYCGGADGIFRINKNRVPESIRIRDNIKSLFFKDVLFFTNNIQQAFVFDRISQTVNPVFELQGVKVDNLILDDDDNIFFTQGKTLFRVKIGTRAVNSHERFSVTAITTDAYFKPFVCTTQGVYVYNKYKYVLDKVADMNNLRAMTFNREDEPFYAVLDIIIKLKRNPMGCARS